MTKTFLDILYVCLLYCNVITDVQKKKKFMTVCNLGIVTKQNGQQDIAEVFKLKF
jgi:hypothetical protein